MEVNVMGIENVDFTSKDGNHIKGISIHLEQKVDSARGVGSFTVKKFVSQDRYSGKPALGICNLDMDFSGNIHSVIFNQVIV